MGTEDVLTEKILKVFYEVYNELGYGFLEAVYERAMEKALRAAGMKVEAQLAVPVSFRGEVIGVFKADLIVEGKVILELKVAEQITKIHEAQLTHYLRASSVEVGLVLNFGQVPRARRIEFLNERKGLRTPQTKPS